MWLCPSSPNINNSKCKKKEGQQVGWPVDQYSRIGRCQPVRYWQDHDSKINRYEYNYQTNDGSESYLLTRQDVITKGPVSWHCGSI